MSKSKKIVRTSLQTLDLLANVAESFGGMGHHGYEIIDYRVFPPVYDAPYDPVTMLEYITRDGQRTALKKLRVDIVTDSKIEASLMSAHRSIMKKRGFSRIPFNRWLNKLVTQYQLVIE
jgi:hypothetical protein